MSHPDDIMPYASREDLFNKINRLSCENDNLRERIMKLETFHVEHSENIEYESTLEAYESKLPGA